MKFLQFTRRRGNENISSSTSGDSFAENPLLRNDFLSPPSPGIQVQGAHTHEHADTGRYRGNEGTGTGAGTGRTRRKDHRRFSYKVMKCIGNILAIASTLTFLIAVPMITYNAMVNETARADFATYYSAGAFVLITLILSMNLIYNHLTNWYMPDVQKYVVRILFMVPIFAVQSWLSLRFRNARIYIDTLRDLYEAFVIQSFMYYLMELLGGEDTLVQTLQEKDAHYGVHLGIVRFFIPPWEMGFDFMANCKYGVLLYVVAKIFATVATAFFEPIGLFREGELSWTNLYIYISFIINMTQMWALYCLVKFYHATHDNLASPVNWKPLGKFMCIKGVVFFTWWQGVAIAVLKSYNVIGDIGQWDVNDVANGLQDYLICVEMFCFAIAHAFTFTHKEYLPARDRNRGLSGGGYAHAHAHAGSDDHLSAGGEGDEGAGDVSLDYTEFRPPVIRTLNTPMRFSDAFWSSTVPNETLNDIRRFRSGTNEEDLNNAAADSSNGASSMNMDRKSVV